MLELVIEWIVRKIIQGLLTLGVILNFTACATAPREVKAAEPMPVSAPAPAATEEQAEAEAKASTGELDETARQEAYAAGFAEAERLRLLGEAQEHMKTMEEFKACLTIFEVNGGKEFPSVETAIRCGEILKRYKKTEEWIAEFERKYRNEGGGE